MACARMLRLGALTLALLVPAAGCQRSPVLRPVSGKISYRGTALTGGVVPGNAGELRNELAHYVDHARKSNAPARRRRARSGAGREQSARIREWAKSRGFKVNERGRIPANIVAEYEAAH